MIDGMVLSGTLTAIVVAFFIMDYFFMFQYDHDRKQEGKGWNWGYTLFSVALGLIILLQPILLPQIAWSTDSAAGLALQILGGFSVLLSFILHIWSRTHLRHFYTERVEVQQGHEAIHTGPYALVRHPIFTSFFLLTGGILLINPAITTLAVLIYTITDFSNAAIQEEQALLNQNVAGYDQYMKRVPRFFPHLRKAE